MIVPHPTFAYAELYATSIELPVVKVPLTAENYAFDLSSMQQVADSFDGISLFYLCNPNNPTATITDTAALREWIESAPDHHYFLLDEAYSEYVTDPSFESGVAWIRQQQSDNLIVIRTFSKLCALAGMRVGYATASREMIAKLERFISIDNTNLSGAVAALATLDELGLRYLPSQASFIFHEIKGDVQTYINRMREHGIAVGREFSPITGFNRLTLGRPDEMAVFVEVLKSFREQGWV